MKRKIYFLVLAVLCLTTLAQKYRPLDSTLKWSAERFYKVNGFCLMTTYSSYHISGYTLNSGRIWHKLYESGNHSPSGQWCTSFPPPFNNALSGYIYNDSLNRKVYYVNNLPANYSPVQSDMLYDFNKSVGDTFFIMNSFNFKINSIDSLLFSNKYHKRYHTSAIGQSPLQGNITFVEGIGSSIGPFVHASFFESGSRLLCFASPTQTMTITNFSMYNNGYCQGLAVDIDEKERHSIQSIYPNPFHNSLIVDLPATEIRVYDALGHLVLEKKISKDKNYLETEFLSPGIYFLRTEGFTKKIIKQ